TLADAVRELSRAGATAGALDLLLDDPAPPELRADERNPTTVAYVDHDAALADALASTTAVLAVDAPFDFDDFEREFLERADAAAAVRRLREDITDAGDPLISTDMPTRRLQSLAALSLAVERRAALAPDERDDAAALVRALAPGMGEEAGAFAERRLIERAAEHARGLSVVASTLGLRTPREV